MEMYIVLVQEIIVMQNSKKNLWDNNQQTGVVVPILI